ncbi:MarR family winged helix-turn-helix transcriptional regulator [Tateyamaria sp. syn59]|uniref:MarR family winged helix-turn-helix transcriptional regulator n=1 Tax=Tateyamaria sp. syn59 TaxID=2576942 RepID=UPI0011BFBF71|nr:MarR family transcriptional regulator [Tateyamaria sp. syn59]
MRDTDPSVFFEVFNEIGIIEQLSRAILEARLPYGLIAPHFTVLNHLTRVSDGRTPMEMARAFQVPKTSMTHTLKGLEEHGLVEMRPNPEDGRSKRVWLTDKGREVRADTIAALGPEFAKLAEDFDVARLVEIRPVLTELREYLDAARD